MKSRRGRHFSISRESIIFPAALTLLIYSAFMLLRLVFFDSDFSGFVTAGDRFVDGSQTPTTIRVLTDSGGYDGQFYYRLAVDPFTSGMTDHGVTFDYPSWRQQRIVYS